jgi:sigma-B regulation protein RsbU (phosphoserine phosphatase)
MMQAEHGRVLVVLDDQPRRERLARQIEESGFAVISASNTLDAATSIRDEEPHVVVIDAHAAPEGATCLLKSMQAEPTSATIPVIVLAPDGDSDAVQCCLDAGAEDFLYEPYSASILKAQVREYVAISSRRRQELRGFERENLLKLERDVQIARKIQESFLPSELPQPAGWEIAARFHPAREVAGDFYDSFQLTQGRRVALVIADVCDKGVGAALFMALFRSLYRAYSQQNYSMRWTDVMDEGFTRGAAGPSPRKRLAPQTGTVALKNAMNLTNDYLLRNHADANMFATTFFAVLDPATGQVNYVNGGHNPPVVIGPDGIKDRLKATGPAPGIVPDVDFQIGQTQMEPGDVLFAFTDGVTDAKNPAGQLFTEKRMLALIEPPAASALELLDRVDDELRAHISTALQFDDITMLAARRSPK